MSNVRADAVRHARLMVATCLMAFAGFLLPATALAQHTSMECPPQSAIVSSGGSVTIDISSCEVASMIGGEGE